MWRGKGRSGIGDKNIDGTYEDWTGLSPNGRQFKNPLTQEVRDLSGAEYWNARKADTPSRWQDIPTHINGKPCIGLFSEDSIEAFRQGEHPLQQSPQAKTCQQPKPKKKEVVHPGEEALHALDKKELAFYKLYKQNLISESEWQAEKKKLDKLRDNAWNGYLETYGGTFGKSLMRRIYEKLFKGYEAMQRMYNVIRIVEDAKMLNYGKRLQLNATPMTHSEACVFLSKQTKYKWCRDLLEEISVENS